MTNPSIEEIRESVNKLFSAISSSPAAMMLGSEAKDAAWELNALINPKEENTAAKVKQQAENPHDHQDYCEGCQSMTDMWIEDTTKCEVCRTRYPDGHS